MWKALCQEKHLGAAHKAVMKANVFIFSQSTAPVFDKDAKLMLSAPFSLLTAPSGNGAVFNAFKDSGALMHAKEKKLIGVQIIPVDNLLAKIADPTFFGFAYTANANVILINI